MKRSIEKIIELLNKKRKEKYSGKITISYNSGGIVGVIVDKNGE